MVIAHRGAAAEAPENTIEAFDLAVELGADALELDVQRAGDGTLVVIHDPTVDRTTDGRGRVSDFDQMGLARLGVPTLEGVLQRYGDLEVTVDVKDVSATAEVVALIHRLRRVGRSILYVEEGTSLDAFMGYEGRRATSSVQAAGLSRRVAAELAAGREAAGSFPAGFPEVVHTPLSGPDGVIVSEGFVTAVQESGRTIQVWTIDDPAYMHRLARWGVDGIITNDVRQAVRWFREDNDAT